MLDHLLSEFKATDYNGESSLRAVKALAFFRAFYEEQGWKFNAWADDAVQRVWGEMASEHDDVRAYISDLLTFTDRIKWAPAPSKPTPEVFVRECRVLPIDVDVMGCRGLYHLSRVHELVVNYTRKRAKDDETSLIRLHVDSEDKGRRRQSPKGVGDEGRRCGLHGGTRSSGD